MLEMESLAFVKAILISAMEIRIISPYKGIYDGDQLEKYLGGQTPCLILEHEFCLDLQM